MKNSHYLLILLGLIGLQPLQAQVRIGIKAGVNSATLKVSNPSVGPSQQARIDFQGGFIVDVPLTNSFSIQPALLISTKGSKINSFAVDSSRNPVATPFTNTLKLVYVEVPVLALFRFEISPSLRLYGGIGPYLGIGVGGRLSSTLGIIGEREAQFGSGNGTYRRLDYGLSGAAGLEWHRLLLGVNYNHGLVDLGNVINKSYHRTLGFSIGYWLSQNPAK